MVLFTPEKRTFKGSKKQHQLLAQTAYYQAGKIVVQTILPEQSPVALITLNTLGTTCSTSADTYIPTENIFNTQSCSSLESRLVSLYGGKAASLLVEYEQRLRFFYKNSNSFFNDSSNDGSTDSSINFSRAIPKERIIPRATAREKIISFDNSEPSKKGPPKQKNLQLRFTPIGYSRKLSATQSFAKRYRAPLFQRSQKLTKQKTGKQLKANAKTKLINNVQGQIFDLSELTLLPNKKWKPNGKTHFVRTCFAGAGNNIFQSTLGNIEIQTATRLARIMVNYWNFYSLNKISLYSLFKKHAPAHNFINNFNGSSNDSFNDSSMNFYRVIAREITPIPSVTLYPYGVQQKAPSGSNSLATLSGYRGKGVPLRGNSNNSYAVTKEKIIQNSIPFRGRGDFEGIPIPAGARVVPIAVPYPVKGKELRRLSPHTPMGYSKKPLYPTPMGYIRKPLQGLPALLPLRGFCERAAEGIKLTSFELEAKEYTKRRNFQGIRIWGIKLKVKDKTPQGNIIYKYKVTKRWNNFYFAIAQSKNSLKICENKNSSSNIQRLSIENIGNYSQLNNNNFQLINSLQFSHLQRDRFYPNWFRLYLPDMEATEFLKNVANYYFSLGLQTFTFPSTKSSYYFTPAFGNLQVSTASPFLTFLNKNTQKEKYKFNSLRQNKSSIWVQSKVKTPTPFTPSGSTSFATLSGYRDKGVPRAIARGYPPTNSIPSATHALTGSKAGIGNSQGIHISSYTYCPPSILINSTFAKSINSQLTLYDKLTWNDKSSICKIWLPLQGMRSKARDITDLSFTKVAKDQLDPLNVPFSLLLESQIFPLNYNGFSIVEKELLYNALVNSSFAKAFYLINQNRQLLDFFVDYLLRFQILRQHQILYLFSTLLLGCNKTT